jgi:hypothetical protein
MIYQYIYLIYISLSDSISDISRALPLVQKNTVLIVTIVTSPSEIYCLTREILLPG